MTFSEADTSSEESAHTSEDSENEYIISSIESATSISPISDVSLHIGANWKQIVILLRWRNVWEKQMHVLVA